VVEETLRPHVAHLGAHEAPEVAWRHVLDVEELEQLVVVLMR